MMKRLKGWLLGEGVRTPKLYHTSPNWWSNILEDGLIKSSDMRNYADELALMKRTGIGNKYRRFISFGRSLQSSWANPRGGNSDNRSAVSLEFDANKLRADYKIVPVDYFSYEKTGEDDDGMVHVRHGRGQGVSETEERLLTNKPAIPIEPYLTAVHVAMTAREQHIMDQIWRAKRVPKWKFATDAEIKHAENLLDSYEEELGKVYSSILEFTNKYPEVPVYAYRNNNDYYNARWADAEQINPKLESHDDDRDDTDE